MVITVKNSIFINTTGKKIEQNRNIIVIASFRTENSFMHSAMFNFETCITSEQWGVLIFADFHSIILMPDVLSWVVDGFKLIVTLKPLAFADKERGVVFEQFCGRLWVCIYEPATMAEIMVGHI